MARRSPPKSVLCSRWLPEIVRRLHGACVSCGADPLAGAVARAAWPLPLRVHVALLTDHRTLAPGEIGHVAVIAASRDQAATVFNYVRGFLMASPLLAGQVESISRDEIMLRGDICISVVTNSFRVARGMTLLAVIGDEVSYWRDETSAQPDVETYRAVLPSLVASGGMFVGICTGYRRTGLLFEKHRDHFGRDDDDVLCISGPTEVFNPTIDPLLIAKAREQDPESAEAEWDGGFRRDIAAFLSDRDIDAAVDHDRPTELPPRSGLRYYGFADPSGGRHDAYCLAIGHFEGTRTDGRFVLDVVRGVQPPFDPQTTTRGFATLLQEYRLGEVVGDTYAADWVETAFRDAGIRYVRSDKPKSQLYLEAQTLFARGGISLPNHPVLLRELRSAGASHPSLWQGQRRSWPARPRRLCQRGVRLCRAGDAAWLRPLARLGLTRRYSLRRASGSIVLV